VRDAIHAFDERGFDALDPEPSGGRREKIGEQVRGWICAIARTSPADRRVTAFYRVMHVLAALDWRRDRLVR
jgi:hypothetical protein